MLLSEKTEHTGKFFGQIDGTIMDSLVQDRIYRRIQLMDYQGICSDKDNPYRAAGEIVRPATIFSWLIRYFTTYLGYFSFLIGPSVSWPHSYSDSYTYDSYDEDSYNPIDYPYGIEEAAAGGGGIATGNGGTNGGGPILPTGQTERITPSQPPKSTTSSTTGPRVIPDPAQAKSCDLTTDLYLLQPDRLNQSGQNNPLKVSFCVCDTKKTI